MNIKTVFVRHVGLVLFVGIVAIAFSAILKTVWADVNNTPTTSVVVTNSPPTVTSVILNGGNPISLTANATTSFNINYTVTDNNGCADIKLTTSTVFRNGVNSTCAVPNPTTNNLNCYLYVTHTTSTCSGNSITATDTVQLWYFAQSTGNASSSFPSDNWEAFAIAGDQSGATGSATSSGVAVNVLTAINLTTSSINYGSLAASSTTGGINQNVTSTNAGNSSTTLQVSASATLTSGANSIATSSQRFATSTFTFPGGATQLTATAQTVTGFLLTAPTSTTNVAQTTFWGIQVPAGTATGTYSGTNVFTSLFNP